MILKLRIDDRLLHGQVAYSWKSALAYEAIVIASDVAAKDEMRKMAMKLGCPEGIKLAVRTIQKAALLLKNPQLTNMRVFVICANPKSVYELLQLLEEKPVINIGGMQKETGKEFFSKAVYVSKEDLDYLDRIQSQGYHIEVQEVPTTAIHDYASLRNKIVFKDLKKEE